MGECKDTEGREHRGLREVAVFALAHGHGPAATAPLPFEVPATL